MKLITSLSIERSSSAISEQWPHGADRLVVLVWQPDPHIDLLVAIAIDPAHGRGRILAEVELPRAALGAFLEAVIEGRRDIDRRCRVVTGSHHAAATDPRHLVRNASLALSGTLRADERLAEAVVTSSPRGHADHCEAPAER